MWVGFCPISGDYSNRVPAKIVTARFGEVVTFRVPGQDDAKLELWGPRRFVLGANRFLGQRVGSISWRVRLSGRYELRLDADSAAGESTDAVRLDVARRSR